VLSTECFSILRLQSCRRITPLCPAVDADLPYFALPRSRYFIVNIYYCSSNRFCPPKMDKRDPVSTQRSDLTNSKTSVSVTIVSLNVAGARLPPKQERGAGLKRHQTVATDRGVQCAGREFDWPDGRVAKDRCGRFGSWARYCRLPFERLAARLPCSPGFA
jgi:hypothetical protein